VIGTALIPKLVERGYQVLAGDLKPLPINFPAEVQYLHQDLNDLDKGQIADFSPEAFIHLAAAFERSEESPEFWDISYRHNLRLSHHLVGVLRSTGTLKRIVNASSYLVYDPSLYMSNGPDQAPVELSERSRISPRNLIGSSKYFHELELEFISRTTETPIEITSARIFRGYGCGGRDVISRWVRMALAGNPIEVFGEKGAFDYVFAEDSAEGLLRILDAKDLAGVVNLGGGEARRVGDIVEILRGFFPDLQVAKGTEFEKLESSVADVTRLANSLQWRPEHSLEDGIAKIVSYEESLLAESNRGRPA